MAVIQSIPGLEATIEVGGATVNEYDDPNDEAKEMKADDFDLTAAYTQDMDLPCVVRYIEAVPGPHNQPLTTHLSCFRLEVSSYAVAN
jgi:hypothetical protein